MHNDLNSLHRNSHNNSPIDKALDLTLDLVIAAPREKVWQALTQPELIKQWFAPHPYITPDCRLDLRCGGEFFTLMQSPDGEQYPNSGCLTQVCEPEILGWTDALSTDFRPLEQSFMSVQICLSDHDNVTGYHVHVMHKNSEDKQRHESKGFVESWTQCAKQLEAVACAL